jgi:4-hydroxybenzoate polyprenyltransferase
MTSMGLRTTTPIPATTPSDGPAPTGRVPLCVDLDGTLVKTDLLMELVFGLLRERPSNLLRLPGWLFRGKSYLKTKLASLVSIDIATLPYHEEVLAYVRAEKASGRQTYLVTASPAVLANLIAAHVGLFDGVMATENGSNLMGKTKRDRLVEAFGDQGFEYMGNAWSDLPIWKASRSTLLVNPHFGVATAAALHRRPSLLIDGRPSLWRETLAALRAHQWLKNILVFVPLLTSHRITDTGLILSSLEGFVGLSLCASAIYLFNDLMDLNADRGHPTKKERSLASGRFPTTTAVVLIPVLLGLADAISRGHSPLFKWSLLTYAAVSVAYSVWLKKHELVDVIVLAGLWTLRIIIGSAVTGITLSFWLLAFTMFLFMSFALAKRCSELYAVRSISRERSLGRDYRVTDLTVLASLGGASGFAAVLVLALYVNSPEVWELYGFSRALWLLCPMLMYWVGRVWLKTWRGEMAEDPVLFAVSDRASRWLVLLGAVVLALAL